MVDATTPAETPVSVRRQIVVFAQSYLDGHTGAIETSRAIVDLSLMIDASLDDLFIGFTGIDSESDTFPLGEVRRQWSNTALEREDASRQVYETHLKEKMMDLCQKVVARDGDAPPDDSPFDRGFAGVS